MPSVGGFPGWTPRTLRAVTLTVTAYYTAAAKGRDAQGGVREGPVSSLKSNHTRSVLPTLGALLSSVPGCHGDFLMSMRLRD